MRVSYGAPGRAAVGGGGGADAPAPAAGDAGAAPAVSARRRFSSCACFFQSVSICNEGCSSAIGFSSVIGYSLLVTWATRDFALTTSNKSQVTSNNSFQRDFRILLIGARR